MASDSGGFNVYVEPVDKWQTTAEKVLYSSIKRMVWEKLGSFKNEVITKDMAEGEKKDAFRMVLEMIQQASNEFYVEMATRYNLYPDQSE